MTITPSIFQSVMAIEFESWFCPRPPSRQSQGQLQLHTPLPGIAAPPPTLLTFTVSIILRKRPGLKADGFHIFCNKRKAYLLDCLIIYYIWFVLYSFSGNLHYFWSNILLINSFKKRFLSRISITLFSFKI